MPHWQRALPPIPSARACREPTARRSTVSRVTDIEEISGNGVTAKVDGIPVAAGNAKLMEQPGYFLYGLPSVWVPLFTWRLNGEYAGHILISDVIKAACERSDRKL